MTEIAGIGALNAGLIRAAVQNEEQQVAQQQAQRSDQDGQELAQRRIEQARGGSSDNELGNPGNEGLDFFVDDRQQAQDNDVVDVSIQREEAAVANVQEGSRRSDNVVETTLSNAAERARESGVQIATENVGSAEQSLQDGIAQTESSLDSDDFTRVVDDNRERDDASNLESRASRELGRVLDTFA